MSTLDEQVESFITFKQGLGVQMTTEASMLRHFKRYAQAVGHDGPITFELALSWARSGEDHTVAYEARRYSLARRVSEYSAIFDESSPSLPFGVFRRANARTVPHIYSDEEIALLMRTASAYKNTRDPLRPLAYEVLIGMLRATGMRPSEALELKDSEFDRNKHLLLVKKSKNNRERLIPLDQSTSSALISYQTKRNELRNDFSCKNLIVCDGGKPMKLNSFQHAFTEIRGVLLSKGKMWNRRPPRIYDLRHTYAVKTLLVWLDARRDVNALLPVLAAYMGHTKISETYWYLTGTTELLETACTAFEDLAKVGDRPWQLS